MTDLEKAVQAICPDGLVRIGHKGPHGELSTFRLQDVFAYSKRYWRPGIDDWITFRVYLPSGVTLEITPREWGDIAALETLLHEWLADRRDPYGKPIKEKGAKK